VSHLLTDIDRNAGARYAVPTCQHVLCGCGHYRDQSVQLVALEDRLHHSTLPCPLFAVSRDQPFAQHEFRPVGHGAAPIIGAVFDQDAPDEVRLSDLNCRLET
jgi:hypothetical protein